MSMLNKKVLPALNGKQDAVLLEWIDVANDKGGHTRLKVQLKDRKQDIIIFPSSEDYFLSCLRTQLQIEEEIAANELLDQMIEEGTVFNIWFYYDEQYGFQYRFHETSPNQSEEAEAI